MLYYGSIKFIFKEENKMDVKDLLTNEIEKLIKSLEGMEVDSDEYKATSDAIVKLTGKLNEMDQINYEYWDKKESREKDSELKLKQLNSEKRDRIVKNVLTAVSIVGGFVLTIWGTKASFEFEKEGSITTIMGRGFINNLLPKKQN